AGAGATVEAVGFGYPVFVKPSNLGSSVGVTNVHRASELPQAVALETEYDEWILVEEAVDGREIEVAILGNAEARASVPGEIVSSHALYDYDDMYVDGSYQLLVPAPLSVSETAEVRDLALQAFRALP